MAWYRNKIKKNTQTHIECIDTEWILDLMCVFDVTVMCFLRFYFNRCCWCCCVCVFVCGNGWQAFKIMTTNSLLVWSFSLTYLPPSLASMPAPSNNCNFFLGTSFYHPFNEYLIFLNTYIYRSIKIFAWKWQFSGVNRPWTDKKNWILSYAYARTYTYWSNP